MEEAAAAAESLQEQAQVLTQAVAVFKVGHNESKYAVAPAQGSQTATATVTALPPRKPVERKVAPKTEPAVRMKKVANAKAGEGEWEEF